MIQTLQSLNNPGASTDVDFIFDADLASQFGHPAHMARILFTVGDLQQAYLQALVLRRWATA